jgi:hypothetical protein
MVSAAAAAAEAADQWEVAVAAAVVDPWEVAVVAVGCLARLRIPACRTWEIVDLHRPVVLI